MVLVCAGVDTHLQCHYALYESLKNRPLVYTGVDTHLQYHYALYESLKNRPFVYTRAMIGLPELA